MAPSWLNTTLCFALMFVPSLVSSGALRPRTSPAPVRCFYDCITPDGRGVEADGERWRREQGYIECWYGTAAGTICYYDISTRLARTNPGNGSPNALSCPATLCSNPAKRSLQKGLKASQERAARKARVESELSPELRNTLAVANKLRAARNGKTNEETPGLSAGDK